MTEFQNLICSVPYITKKSYWRLARMPATQQGMSNAWLAAQGPISIRDQWMKAQGYR